MRIMYKYFFLLVLLTGFVQVDGKATIQDTEIFSTMSEKELNEAFITAINNGELDEVGKLLEAGANVNYVDHYGNTPLIIAVDHARALSQFSTQAQERYLSRWEQREEIVQIILNLAANVNHADNDGNTALMVAIENHDLNTVQNLLKTPGININQFNNDGDTALIIAIEHIQYSYIDGNIQQYYSCIYSQDILDKLLQTPEINLFHTNKNGDTAIDLLIKLAERLPYL